MKTNIKIIATSLALVSSFSAWAGIGGLSVQSHLGQPFSGSIVVTGDEAQALQSSRSVSVAGGGIRGSVMSQGNGNVVVRLRSSSPIREPIITFTVSAGRQTREYTAMLNPANYVPQEAPQHVEKSEKPAKTNKSNKSNKASQTDNTSGTRDFIHRNSNQLQENTLPIDNANPVVKRQPTHEVPTHEAPTHEAPTREAPTREAPTREAPTREARKNSGSTSSNVTAGAPVNSQPIRQSGKIAVSPRRYHAQSGETLSNIAERYRPRNMSVQTASRALAMANPSAFKRGNTVQRSTTLYIPTPAQWYAYAERAQYHAPAARPARPARATVNTVPDNQPITQAAVEPQTAPATPVAQPKPVPAKPAPVTPPPVAKPATPAAVPATPATTAPATPAAAVTATPASPAAKAASAVATATQPVKAAVASAVQAASTVVASHPALPPIIPPDAVSTPADVPSDEATDDEGIDWVTYAPIGLGVLGVLGVVYLLSRRRGAVRSEPDDDENDGVQLIDEGEEATKGKGKGKKLTLKKNKKLSLKKDKKAAEAATVATAATAATAATLAPTMNDDHDFSLDKEDDSSNDYEPLPDDEDDVFFEAAPLNDTHTTPTKSFDLNDFEPDNPADFNSHAADTDDNDWRLDNDNQDELDSLASSHKAAVPEQDWSLDDNDDVAEADPFAQQDDDDDPFSAFNDDEDFPAAPAKPKSAAAELEDLDAMFASALKNIDTLEKEAAEENAAINLSKGKSQSVGAELDDIDAMFASKLADIDHDLPQDDFVSRKHQQPKEDIDDLKALSRLDDDLAVFEQSKATEDLNDLAALHRLDDELASFEQSKAKKPVAEEADDEIDAMFAGALADLDSWEREDDSVSDLSAHEFDSLNSLSDLDDFDEMPIASGQRHQPVDDVDAMFADVLLGLGNDNHGTPPSHNAHSVDSLDLDNLNLDNDLLVSDAELDSLNSLSEFDQMAAFESASKPKVAQVDEFDSLFADSLADLEDNRTTIKPKPMISDAEMESLNSLSELDNLDKGKSVNDMDAMFDDALADLDTLDDKHDHAHHHDEHVDSLSELDTLAFETPTVVDEVAEEPAFDAADGMSFDLSDFDTTPATQPEEEILTHDDAMSFDLSHFDTPATVDTEVELPNFDADEGLAFDTTLPELPEPSLDTPVVEDDIDSLNFDLPSAGGFEHEGEFSDDDFVLPDGDDVGFVSSSVGGGADTFEAKLELAKMYIEIDDINSARSMLRELVKEADGDVANQAKVLLAQIS